MEKGKSVAVSMENTSKIISIYQYFSAVHISLTIPHLHGIQIDYFHFLDILTTIFSLLVGTTDNHHLPLSSGCIGDQATRVPKATMGHVGALGPLFGVQVKKVGVTVAGAVSTDPISTTCYECCVLIQYDNTGTCSFRLSWLSPRNVSQILKRHPSISRYFNSSRGWRNTSCHYQANLFTIVWTSGNPVKIIERWIWSCWVLHIETNPADIVVPMGVQESELKSYSAQSSRCRWPRHTTGLPSGTNCLKFANWFALCLTLIDEDCWAFNLAEHSADVIFGGAQTVW